MTATIIAAGRFEAGRQIRNLWIWLSFTPALIWTVLAQQATDEHFLLTGFGLVVGWFTMLAVGAGAARRSRAPGVAEMLETLPAGHPVPTLAVGLGSVGALAAGLAVTLVVWAVRWPPSTLGVTTDTIPAGLTVPRPNLAQFLQGPLIVPVFLGIGMVIGRWVPSWLVVPAAVLPIALQFLWFGIWASAGTEWSSWLLPMANGWVSNEWRGDCGGVGACQLEVSGFDMTTPWWHAGYLIAFASALMLAAALGRSMATISALRIRVAAAVAICSTIALAIVQVATYERWSPL